MAKEKITSKEQKPYIKGMDTQQRPQFICCQEQFSRRRGTFGPLGNAASNGCGFIALYNVRCFLGCWVPAPELLNQINREWWKSTLAGGLLGCNPLYLWKQVSRLPGVRCRILVCAGSSKSRKARWRRKLQDVDRSCDGFLNLYLHRRGAHYTAAEYRNDGFHIYNDWCRSADHEAYYQEAGALGMIVLCIKKTVHQEKGGDRL